jgi:hypothetical protein
MRAERVALLPRQSDYGVTPFSALGGLMKVQDSVAITFELVAMIAKFKM